MITYWKQADGKFINLEKKELDKDSCIWIDARNVTRDDISVLENEYRIDQDHIIDILDPEEQSRIEDGDGYILTIIRLPIFIPTAEASYSSVPLGVILTEKFIMTICWTDCEVLRDFSSNRVKGINLSDFPAFLIQILSRADITYLRYLKEINRRAQGIQGELQFAIENKEILQLLNLQKSMVFFTTSIKGNQLLLEKLKKTRLMKFDEDDMDWLNDVEIDNRQALEMASTYSDIFSKMIDAFGSVISNNMNLVMKKLTIVTVVIAVPTFITSFFGMNVYLPFVKYEKIGLLIITGLCAMAFPLTRLILGDSQHTKSVQDRETKEKNKIKRSAIRKLKKTLEAQEMNLEGKK